MLIKAICRAATPKIVNETRVETQPKELNPRLRTCGIGPIRSTVSGVTNASTEPVPKINISAMMGAEIITDCPMVRPALRDSPARIATYSNPLSAPTVICPKIARPNHDGRGGCQGIGS